MLACGKDSKEVPGDAQRLVLYARMLTSRPSMELHGLDVKG